MIIDKKIAKIFCLKAKDVAKTDNEKARIDEMIKTL